MLTADTITDEQIHDLRETLTGIDVWVCEVALGFRESSELSRVAARGRCADALNASAQRNQGFDSNRLNCSRCGARVHRSWDHLDATEHGDRWMCMGRQS